MSRLHAYYRPDIQRTLEAEPKPNPWHDVRLRDEAPRLPKWARITLRAAIGLFVAWWVFTWVWELTQ